MGRGLYKNVTYKVLDYDQLNDQQLFGQVDALILKLKHVDQQNPGLHGLNAVKEVMLDLDEIIKVHIRRHGNADAIIKAFNKPVYNFNAN